MTPASTVGPFPGPTRPVESTEKCYAWAPEPSTGRTWRRRSWPRLYFKVMNTSFLALLQLTQVLSATPSEPVVSAAFVQPPASAAWVGDAPHRFMDGQVVLTCSSHGVFSGGGEPPREAGRSSTISYQARFTGELQLNPPLVPAPRTVKLDTPIHMRERMTARGSRDGRHTFDTELLAVEFSGAGLPDNIRVRESPRRKSTGKSSFSTSATAGYAVQGNYSVWLEVSVDGGRRWHLAEQDVGMRLQAAPATLRAR